ncbi:MAG: DUF2796 domain-containing protein [Hyphomonas sp.]|nr:DUF2796 domain-containing protein [Hyphomonas sp.]
MSRTVFLLAASSLALVACQPAEDAATALEPETPPVIEQPAEVEEVSVPAEDTTTETVEVQDAHEDGEEHEGDEHDDHDDHDEHYDHSDDEHADHDEDAHAHDDDHDHGEAGGEAHVHGLSDLAASLDASTLSVSVEGALANFDLDESLRALDDVSPYTDGVIQIVGGDCTRNSGDASIRAIGDHGNLMIDLTYTCAAPGNIEGIEVTGFQSFAGFEEVNAVYLTDAGQSAETLTTGNTRLDID